MLQPWLSSCGTTLLITPVLSLLSSSCLATEGQSRCTATVNMASVVTVDHVATGQWVLHVLIVSLNLRRHKENPVIGPILWIQKAKTHRYKSLCRSTQLVNWIHRDSSLGHIDSKAHTLSTPLNTGRRYNTTQEDSSRYALVSQG